MHHTFKFGTAARRRPALDEEDDNEIDGADPEDHVYMYDVSKGVEGMLADMVQRYGHERGGPVQRFADMPPEKQAEMRRLYERPGAR